MEMQIQCMNMHNYMIYYAVMNIPEHTGIHAECQNAI